MVKKKKSTATVADLPEGRPTDNPSRPSKLDSSPKLKKRKAEAEKAEVQETAGEEVIDTDGAERQRRALQRQVQQLVLRPE